jgi:hypothetical protein
MHIKCAAAAHPLAESHTLVTKDSIKDKQRMHSSMPWFVIILQAYYDYCLRNL